MYGLSCNELRSELAALDRATEDIARRRAQTLDLCLHDEVRRESDYQAPKPYWRCTGCGRTFYTMPQGAKEVTRD